MSTADSTDALVPEVLPAIAPLPGEGACDDDAVERAVAEINRLHTAKGLETARVIGEYIVREFFDGNIGEFQSRGKKHSTFKALGEHARLAVSTSFLWYAVALLEQLRLLPDNVAEALPMSHHRLLIPIKDQEQKVELAVRAVDKGMSKRKLQEEIAKLRRGKTRRSGAGRPPLPAFVKGLSKLKKAIAEAASEPISADVFAHYQPADAKLLLHEVEQSLGSLQVLRDKIQASIEAEERQAEDIPPGE